jgi:NADH pyrophosphatase NudC (nudix superfamily)
MSLHNEYEYDEEYDEEYFFCGRCGDEVDQITYINGDVCNKCENEA